MTVKEEKRVLRNQMFSMRIKQDPDFKKKYDSEICLVLEKKISAYGFKTVHAYIPIAGEIDILPLLDRLLQEKVQVICPKTLPHRQLENRILSSLEDLELGIKGTLHPAEKNVYTGAINLVIVPGLAFDVSNYRLGYGGAYYDTFIKQEINMKSIGIFYPFQKIEQVPREPHDMKLDEVLFFDDFKEKGL